MTEVSASEVTGNKLTIGNPMEGHTYKVYQIFQGQVSSDGKKLSNVEYGKNYTGSGDAGITAADEAEALAQSVDGLGESKAAKEFAKKVRTQIEDDTASESQKAAFVVLNSENQYSAEVELGYYLVVDESSLENAANDAISDCIVGIIGKDVTVQPKAVTVPDFDKSVDNKDMGTIRIEDINPGEIWNIAPVPDEDKDDYENSSNNEEVANTIVDKIKDDPIGTLTVTNPSMELPGGYYIIWLTDEDGNVIKSGMVTISPSGTVTYSPEKGATTTVTVPDGSGTTNIYKVFSGDVQNNGSIKNATYGPNYSGSSGGSGGAGSSGGSSLNSDVSSFTGAPDSKIHASSMILTGNPVATISGGSSGGASGGSSVNLDGGYYVTKTERPDGSVVYDTLVVGSSGGTTRLDPDITNLVVTNPQDGFTYEVYQVFTGYVHDDFTITNPAYGKNYSGRDSLSLTDDVSEFTRVADKKVYGKTVRPYLFGEPYTILSTQDPCITIAPGLYVAISKNSKGEVQEVGAVVADPEKQYSGFDHELNTNIHKHDFTKSIIKEATCLEDGEILCECECGFYYTQSIPSQHDYEVTENINHIELDEVTWESKNGWSTKNQWYHTNNKANLSANTWTVDIPESCIIPVEVRTTGKYYEYTFTLDGIKCRTLEDQAHNTIYLRLNQGFHTLSLSSDCTNSTYASAFHSITVSFLTPYIMGNLCTNGGEKKLVCKKCHNEEIIRRDAGCQHEYIYQKCKVPVASWKLTNSTHNVHGFWTNTIDESENTYGNFSESVFGTTSATWETYLPETEYLPDNAIYNCVFTTSAGSQTDILNLKPGLLTYKASYYCTDADDFGKPSKVVYLPPVYKEIYAESCKYCGKLKGHYYIKYIHPATCTDEGYTEWVCAECGDSYRTDIIPALGHEYHNYICTRCGELDGEVGTYSELYSNWAYTVDQTSKRVVLNYYKGKIDAEHVTVYGAYKIGEETYRTALKQSTQTNSSYTYMFHATQKISNGTFYLKIKSITFNPGIDMSGVTNIGGMFANCAYLTQVDMSDLDTSKVSDMNNLFSSCSALENINLSQIDMKNVVNMQAMFDSCKKLKTVTFGNLDLQNVEDMTELFDYCSALDTIDMSHVKTQKLKNIKCMFRNCSALTKCNLSDLNVDSVTDINSLFMGDRLLTNINLDGWNTKNVTNMAYMFSGCSSLTNITISEKWEMQNGIYKYNMFQNCGLPLSEKQKLDPSYVESSAVIPLSVFSRAFASELNDTVTPAAIEIDGEDKTVDYAVGDHVPFKLEATMPESISAYEKYKLVFHDKITKGMKYDQDSLKVYVDGNLVDASEYTVTPEDMNGDSLTVTINDVKAEPWNAAAGTKITVKYTAELLEEGTDGAFNEASLDYSNDPNGDGMGTTGGDGEDHDVVEVITFAMTFNKVNKDGGALSGAGFTLYRKGEDGEYAELETLKDRTAFDFDGLKPGDYKLVESTTPDGYNTMEDLIFSIVKEETEVNGEKVISVKLVDANGNALADWSADAENRAFVTDITNFSGSELPSTGGMGTYLFYIAGAALVILIGAVMVSRKENEDEM